VSARQPLERALTLIEALPYIRRFKDAIIVVKYGGNVLADADGSLRELAEDLALMHLVGMRPVLVHGGGPQIDAACRSMGIEPQFIDGLRVTDEATLQAVRSALLGAVNPAIVAALVAQGAPAIGVSGADAGFVRARVRDPRLGKVGEVTEVDASLLEGLLVTGLVPVVASLAVDPDGGHLNVNADSFAAAVAVALGASKLVYLSNVPGLLERPADPESLVQQVDVAGVERMLADGRITGGMVPKVQAALEAAAKGVERVHLIDGTTPHSLLLEILTDEGVGTMIVEEAR
jgi:acetylglutamate kinase